MIAIATWQAGEFTLPGVGDPFARTLGNRALADAAKEAVAQRAAAGSPVRSVVVTDRESAAALLYYARDLATPVTVWRAQECTHQSLRADASRSSAAPGNSRPCCSQNVAGARNVARRPSMTS